MRVLESPLARPGVASLSSRRRPQELAEVSSIQNKRQQAGMTCTNEEQPPESQLMSHSAPKTCDEALVGKSLARVHEQRLGQLVPETLTVNILTQGCVMRGAFCRLRSLQHVQWMKQ